MYLLALAVMLVLLLAACGGSKGTSKPAVTPLAAVQQAARKTAKEPSEHLALKGSVTINGQPVLVSGSGDFKGRAGALTLDFNLGGLTGTLGAVVDGATLYLRSPLFAGALPAGKTWVQLDLARGGALSTVAGQSPASTLANLAALSRVTTVATDNGTTHYRGRLAKTATRPGGSYDVYVGDDGYVHRVTFSSLVAPQERLNTTIDLSDFGKSVTVRIPAASESAPSTSIPLPGIGG